jgi:hypothetical protein
VDQFNDIDYNKLREGRWTGSKGVALPWSKLVVCLMLTKYDHGRQKGLENDPFVSTGALRSVVNSVNWRGWNPFVSTGTANGHFSTGKVVNTRQLLTKIACLSCAVNLS